MNYIHQLQADLSAQIAVVEYFKADFAKLRAWLHSPKFTGDDNGERKDWISTGDVLTWLREVESGALNHGEQVRADWKPPVQYEPCSRCGCTESLKNGLCSDCNTQ